MEVADGPLIGIPLRRQAVYICDGTVKRRSLSGYVFDLPRIPFLCGNRLVVKLAITELL